MMRKTMIRFLAISLKVIVADTVYLIGMVIGRIIRFFRFGPFPRRKFDLGRPTGW